MKKFKLSYTNPKTLAMRAGGDLTERNDVNEQIGDFQETLIRLVKRERYSDLNVCFYWTWTHKKRFKDL